MKKRYLIIITFLVIAGLSINYFHNKFRYSNIPIKIVTQSSKLPISISILGDSWVNETLKNEWLDKKDVYTYSYPGKTSKYIYEALNSKDSTHKLLIQKTEHCIILLGVNDAAHQIGAKNYSYHTTQIIKTLINNGIKPVIIELPEFGIIEAYDKLPFIYKQLNKIYSIYNNEGKLDNIKIYRKQLLKDLSQLSLLDKVTIIKFDSLCTDFKICYPQLYSDEFHLNRNGYKKLAEIFYSQTTQ